jgi:hypothetical protein
MMLYELFQPRLEGMGFLGEKDVEEAANAGQQAAIAISMKNAHKKPKNPMGSKTKNRPAVPRQ